MTYTTTAIILDRRPAREADLLVTFLTRDFGKIEALAIGAKKIQSKLAGHLEPWQEVKVMLVKGRQIDKVGQAITSNNFGIQANPSPESLWQVQEAAVLVRRCAPAGQKDAGLYDFFKTFLATLQKSIQGARLILFRVKLLERLGFSPSLKQCAHCSQSIMPGRLWFNFLLGGVICPVCAERASSLHQIPISPEAIKVWRYWLQKPFEVGLALSLPPLLSKELNHLSSQFLNYHL